MAFRIEQNREDSDIEYISYRAAIHIRKENGHHTFFNAFENQYYFAPLALEIVCSYASSFEFLLLMARKKKINTDDFYFYVLKGRDIVSDTDLSINYPLEEGEYIEDEWTEYKMFPGHYAWYKIGKSGHLFYDKTLYFFPKEENGYWTVINHVQSTTSATFQAAIAIVKRCENDTQQITWELFLKLCGACKEWLNRHTMSHTNQCGTRIKNVAAVKKFVEKWQQTH